MSLQQKVRALKDATIRALQNSFEVCSLLGEDGLREVRKNQHNETALKGDIACEKAVLDCFTRERFPVRVISEEHGTVDIGKNPKFLAVLDGIDGTVLYKKERATGKYGTMIGLFKGLNPLYSEYVIGGIMQHANNKLLIGLKGHGAYVICGLRKTRIKTVVGCEFGKLSKIYVDDASWGINREVFSKPLKSKGFTTSCTQCSCMYYADVAEGLAHFALECTRKGNLEIAAAYGLIKEAGGVMVDLDGNDIGSQKYLEFGQHKHIPVITAANNALARNLIAFLNRKKNLS